MMRTLYNITGVLLFTIAIISCNKERLTEEPFIDNSPGMADNHVQEGVELQYNPYWGWVESYPGLVPNAIERLVNGIKVEVNAVYTPSVPDTRTNIVTAKPWFNTGLYAPPAETVTVIKPTDLSGKVFIQIGVAPTLTGQILRYPTIYTNQELIQDTTRMVNFFGGNIYIVPESPFTKPETFEFKGVVKSPDFTLGTTTPNTWLEAVQPLLTVPFAEISSKRINWNVPVVTLKKITNANDIEQLTKFYDEIIEKDFNIYSGLSDAQKGQLHGSPDVPLRIASDVQAISGAYPMIFAKDILNAAFDWSNKDEKIRSILSAIGHSYQSSAWTWGDGLNGGIVNTSNDFHYMHYYTRTKGSWPDFTSNFQSVINRFVKNSDATKNFDNSTIMKESNAALIPFMQLAQKFGWDLFAYLGKTSRELASEYDVILNDIPARRRSYFCYRVCEYVQKDMRPFFDAWGIKYGSMLSSEMAKLPAWDVNDKFWETFDPAIIPSFEVKSTAPVILLDNSTLVKLVAGDLSRSNWTIANFSSDHSEGRVPAIIDGNNATYWHANWASSATGAPPQWVSINLGGEFLVNQVKFLPRQSGGYQVDGVEIHTSMTGLTGDWTLVSTRTGLNPADRTMQVIKFPEIRAKYIQIRVISTVSASLSIAIAELYAGYEL